MKIIYLVGIILFAVIAYSIYDLYHLSCLFSYDTGCDIAADKKNELAVNTQIRPVGPVGPLNKADLYKESQCISNKGFVNELIYKHPTYSDELQQTSSTLTDSVPVLPLNPGTCQLSSDLPIANIHVKYMLGKNTTMLRNSA